MRAIFGLALALCLTGAAGAQAPYGQQSALERDLAAFDTFLKDFRRENRVQSFSVALVHDGTIVFSRGYGWQDHDAEEPATADTSYLAASITKTFTAATLLQMAEDGHISLDDDFTELSDWDGRCDWLINSGIIFGGGTLDDGTVVEPPQCGEPISLRQVLQHRVNGVPGTSFLYNPVIFGRLSNFVEERTGTAWRDWMNGYVIEPGGLDDIAAGWRDTGKGHVLTHLAPPFRHVDPDADPDGIAPSVLPNTELNASSGIIASVNALAAYAIALDRNRIMPAALKEEMWTPPTDPDGAPAPYAYGWYTQDWEGHRLVWHGGWWPDAYAGLFLMAPDDGWTLVALGNADGIHWGNPLNGAEVEKSALALEFLSRFVAAKD